MSPLDKTAIADFLKSGGRVSRVGQSVQVSEGELVDYLASCGVVAKYRGGDSRAYLCQGKRVSASKLVAIANEHRRSLELPPFALRVAIRYAGARSVSPPKGY
jgi:hypothetical protein